MNIAFATAQSLAGSTNIGRVLPLAQEFVRHGHRCHLLSLEPLSERSQETKASSGNSHANLEVHFVGHEPFVRGSGGKKRLKGIPLTLAMLSTALRSALALLRLHPDVVIISKPLPSNVAGVWLYSLLTKRRQIILDTDDFELTANKLSSLLQRASVHWSERLAAKLAHKIVSASPFLSDHFKQLTQNGKHTEIIATGINEDLITLAGNNPRPKPYLTYLGSLSLSSGHRVDLLPEVLQQCLSSYPDSHLFLAGDGDDVDDLKRDIERRQLHKYVTWYGRFSAVNIKEILATSAIIIDPVDDSIANRAKSSFRVLLALAAGLPVITSNIGIRAQLVPVAYHDRFFAEPGDPASYAEKIGGLLEHPLTVAEREELIEHSRHYAWPSLAAQYQRLINL